MAVSSEEYGSPSNASYISTLQPHTRAICLAPQYVAEELLRLDGLSEVKYVQHDYTALDVLDQGLADVAMGASPTCVTGLDKGKAIVLLGGIHAGCYELFGSVKVRAIPDQDRGNQCVRLHLNMCLSLAWSLTWE